MEWKSRSLGVQPDKILIMNRYRIITFVALGILIAEVLSYPCHLEVDEAPEQYNCEPSQENFKVTQSAVLGVKLFVPINTDFPSMK